MAIGRVKTKLTARLELPPVFLNQFRPPSIDFLSTLLEHALCFMLFFLVMTRQLEHDNWLLSIV